MIGTDIGWGRAWFSVEAQRADGTVCYEFHVGGATLQYGTADDESELWDRFNTFCNEMRPLHPGFRSPYWYRVQDTTYAPGIDVDGNPYPGPGQTVVRMTRFEVVKVTPKGVWLSYFGGSKGKFVLINARKRWACPTPEEAIESFKARKKKQIRIYKSRMMTAQHALIIPITENWTGKVRPPAEPIQLPKDIIVELGDLMK